MHQDAPHLDGQYTSFGKLTNGFDTLVEIAIVETDFSDRPIEKQKIISVSVDTLGTDHPNPKVIK